MADNHVQELGLLRLWGRYAMRRLISAAVLLLVLTMAVAPVAQAAGIHPEWRVAQFPDAPGRGGATSVLSVCADDGGVINSNPGQQCGLGQAGPSANILSPRVTTVFRGRTPGELWGVQVFDRGTCNAVTHFVASAPSIRIGANGTATSRLLFTAAQYRAAAAAFNGRLTLRLTHNGLRYCADYGPPRGRP